MEKATFAAGCFWGVEMAFRRLEGVKKTMVGYIGGTKENPTYQEVCSDTTGHAEAVQIEFDSEKIDYERLLEVFWSIHDPTTLNRQGPDLGSQYRSVIFYHDEDQRRKAASSIEALEHSGRFQRPIVTELRPVSEFYPAEDYHQQYLEKRGTGSCHR